MIKGTFKMKFVACLMALVLSQLSLATAWAMPQISGKLITSGNLPVTINGNSTQGGATILSGAVIETPANVTATIQVGDLGVVELQPGSIAVIDFTSNTIKVTLRQGCVTLDTNKGTSGSIVDSKGMAFTTNTESEEGMSGDVDFRRLGNTQAQSNGEKRRKFPVCGIIPAGASVASATLPGVIAPATTAAAAGGGISGAVLGAIIAGVAGAAIIGGIIGSDDNPSPSSPRR